MPIRTRKPLKSAPWVPFTRPPLRNAVVHNGSPSILPILPILPVENRLAENDPNDPIISMLTLAGLDDDQRPAPGPCPPNGSLTFAFASTSVSCSVGKGTLPAFSSRPSPHTDWLRRDISGLSETVPVTGRDGCRNELPSAIPGSSAGDSTAGDMDPIDCNVLKVLFNDLPGRAASIPPKASIAPVDRPLKPMDVAFSRLAKEKL
mmetsp:Transcript_17210/g.55084  ORF Transcript_17210/g.55084 Transcript_17210/m.55084 type:complete len:205 (+) Transcript_17210:3052-3666(+)